MPDFTSKLRRASARLMGRAAAEIPVPFEVACSCGQRCTGLRQASSQQISCSRCQAQIYVLPVNVYPATRRVHSEVVGGSFANRLLTVTRDFLPGADNRPTTATVARPIRNVVPADDQSSAGTGHSADIPINDVEVARGLPVRQKSPDDPAGSEVAAAPSESHEIVAETVGDMPARRGELPGTPSSLQEALDGTIRQASTSRPVTAVPPAIPGGLPAAETVAPAESTVRPRRLTLPDIDFHRLAKRTFTPFRLLMLSALGVMLLTGWWMVRRNQLEQARRTWRESMDVVEVAIGEKDFGELQTALRNAVTAAATLNRDDAESRSAENLLLETTAMNRLSSGDLVSDLSRAYAADGAISSQRSQTVAKALVSGCHVFDCPIELVDETAAEVRLTLPLRIHSDQISIQVRSSLMAGAAAALNGQSVLMIARIASCTPPEQSPGKWIMTLDPEMCAVLTNELHCEAVGIDADQDPAVREQIRRQKEFVESQDRHELQMRDRRRRDEEASQ